MYASDLSSVDYHPSVLTNIYDKNTNIAIWQRQQQQSVQQYAQTLLSQPYGFEARFIQSTDKIHHQLEKALPLNKHREDFIHDIVLIVDMFACLFEQKNVGLRLAVLDKAMCPRFHVDKVPCRLVCTFTGEGTHWCANEHVIRDDKGTITPEPHHNYQCLQTGDVALLKGESWIGNEGKGLVHRSPSADKNTKRLLLTLDFA